MRRVRWPAVLGVAVLVLVAAACGASEDQYLKNSSKGAYLRVPAGWTRFDVTGADRPSPSYPAPDWQVVLDGAPQPSASNYDALLTDYPAALVSIGRVTARADRVSLQFLRAQATAMVAGANGPIDVLSAVEEGNPNLELVEYREIKDPDFWGTRIVFNAKLSSGKTVTIGEIALVNRNIDTLYQLQVHCLSSCYLSNESAIASLFDSFTLKEV